MIATHFLSYDQIALIPKYSILESRSQADVSIQFGPKKFKLPVMPANMKCTIDEAKAKWLSENDYFYVMHRFHDNFEFITTANKQGWKNISVSVGVKEEDQKLIASVIDNKLRIDYITIDVAHGHSVLVKEMIEFIHSIYSKNGFQCPFIIAGNVATREAVEDLSRWGADAAKVGIAQGGACTTYGKTGFGLPMFTCVNDCANEDTGFAGMFGAPDKKKDDFVKEIPIIADGGIRTNGDFAKALVAGATMVMAGSMFAACVDSPAEDSYLGVVYGLCPNTKPTHKRYYGSASAKNKGNNHHVEGTEIILPCNGFNYETKLQEIKEDLQSAVSYAGGKNLRVFKTVDWTQRG